MLNSACSGPCWTPAPIEENRGRDALESMSSAADFHRLSGEEIERLIAFCKAPESLWRRDPRPARPPEPFGMIA
jgi:hypothetical protein